MNHEDLPERWKQKVEQYIIGNGIDKRTKLCSSDFLLDTLVKLEFEDDSYCEFYYPLVIEAPELNEVGVFTEHCGYHIFNIHAVEVSIISTLNN